MRTVIRADLALTMDPDLGDVAHPEIVVDDGRIADVRSRRDGSGEAAGGPAHANAFVLDLPGRWLLPGFVNAHTHAAMTLLRGYAGDLPLRTWLEDRIWPAEANLDVDIVHAGTRLACVEMLAGGVTTFADMYLHMDGAAQAVAETGIRASLAPGLFAVFGDFDAQLEAAGAFVRRWHGAAGGRITAMLGPHAVYTCPPEALRDVAAAAADLDCGVHIHLSETASEVADAREQWGASPVQLAADAGVLTHRCLAAHAVWVDADDITLLVEAGAAVSHNPRSNARLGSGVAPVGDVLARGVPVALGTDGAASTTQLTLLEEIRAAALLAKVTRQDAAALPARRLLELATVGGARALGLADTIGSLTPGKRGDLIAVRVDRPGLQPVHDPMTTVAYAAQDGDVEWVLVDGAPVAHQGRPLRVDTGDVARAADRAARRLVEGAAG